MHAKTRFHIALPLFLVMTLLLQSSPLALARMLPKVGTNKRSTVNAETSPSTQSTGDHRQSVFALDLSLAETARQMVVAQSARPEPAPVALGKPLPPGTAPPQAKTLFQTYLPLVSVKSTTAGRGRDVLAPAAVNTITIDDGCPYPDPPGFERRAPPAEDAWICISAQNTVYWAYGYNDALYVRTNASPVEWVRWRPTIAQQGWYETRVSIPSYFSNVNKTQQAHYTVHHATGDTNITINQEATAGSWRTLGTFRFNTGTGGYVYLESYTTENPWRLLSADAAQFIFRAPKLTGGLNVVPDAQVPDADVTASFTVRNDSGASINLDLRAGVAGAGDFATVNRTIASGGSYNYQQTRQFSSVGEYNVYAQYRISGGSWHNLPEYGGTYDGVLSIVPHGTGDVRLTSGLELTPSEFEPGGGSVRARFTVQNTSAAPLTENFRARVTNGTDFAASGDRSLNPDQSYSYNETASFTESGTYHVIAQHYASGGWYALLGINAQIKGSGHVRVKFPPPPPPQWHKGRSPSCGQAGEPVNTATGNYFYDFTDLSDPTPGLPLAVNRWYNALDAPDVEGPFGYGTSWTYNMTVTWRTDKSALVRMPDGHLAYFWGEIDPADPLTMTGTYLGQGRDVGHTLTRAVNGTAVLTLPDQTAYRFDDTGRLTRLNHPHPSEITVTYSDTLPVHLVHSVGLTYTLSYSDARITRIAASNGRAVTYTYTLSGNLGAITRPDGSIYTYEYDAQHRLTSAADPNGHYFVRNVYDDQGRVIQQYDQTGQASAFYYGPTITSTRTFTDALGNVMTHTYDADYHLIQEIDPLGHTITYTRDAQGNILARRDKNGEIWRYTYDERGNMLTKTDALEYVWTYTYDDQNNLLTETDPLGNTTTHEYDEQGRLIRKTDPEGGVWEHAYNAQGLATWSWDPVGAETRYVYDDLGLPITVTNALSQTTLLGYDALGRKLNYTDAQSNVVRYAYDALGRTTVITAPDDGLTTFGYDPMGNLISETNALGYTRVFTYDAYNRLEAETDWIGNVTRHEYDVLGRPVRDTDPLGYTAVYTYDAVGRLVARQDKNSNVTTYTYDANGNRLTETDPLSHTMTYVYDALNRVVEALAPCACAGSSHRYTEYDAAGRVIQETDALGNVTTFEYDGTGRLISRTNALGETTTYAYDAAGRLEVETDPLGWQTRYDYDLLGQLITVTNRLGATTVQHYDAVGRVVESIDQRSYATTQTFDSSDRLLQVTDPLSHTTTYTYDLLGNKLSETDALGHTRTFTHDPNGWLNTETDTNDHTTVYAYDTLDRLTQKTDPLGGVTRYTYDPSGNLLTETDPIGHVTIYQYDALDRQIKVIDAEGHETTYGYNEAGNLASRTDAEGNTWTYEYDANNNWTAETNPRGYVTRYEYNALNRQVSTTDPLGSAFVIHYDPLGRVAETVNASGQRTGYTYDGAGHVIALTDALGFYSTRAYDLAGNMIQVVNRLGYTTTYAYDPLNRQTVISDALGGVSTWEYDALGRVITPIDQLGRQTTRAYDPVGNLITATDALGGLTVYGYDALNRQVSVNDPNGHTTLTHYDAAGRALTTTLPGGGEIGYTYDRVGNRLSETDPAGRTTHREYDGQRRVVREVDPLGNAAEYACDTVGNLTLERDALGRETRFAYDALDRLVKVADAGGYETRYIYDPVGNLIRQQDANGHLTQFAYDARNHQVREVNPLGQTWLYQYDAEGRQTGLIKPDGAVILYGYDALGRLLNTDYDDDTPDVTFTYNAAGDRLTMTDGAGTTTYTYDELDRLTRIAYPGGAQVGYGYDSVGNRVQVDYPFGGQVNYVFDADDRLQTVTTTEGVVAYTRDPSGLPRRVDYPNGAYVAYSYDGAGRVVGVTNGNAGGAFASYAFDLNAVGNKTQKTETLVEGGNTTQVTTLYTYDARDQLVDSVASDGIETHYTFDGAGNRVRVTGARQREAWLEPYTVDYAYNAINQLLTTSDSALGQTTYVYDDNGNRSALLSPGRRALYAYDAEDRLTATQVWVLAGEDWVYLDGKEEIYAYDGQSRRVRKTALDANSGATLWQRDYVYGSDWNVLQESTLPTPARRYIYDDAMQKLQTLVGGVPGYLHYDDLGSSVGYTQSDGALRDEDGLRRYGDYGDVLGGGASWWTDTAYTGHEREAYSGLYYARHRYYDPETGGWLTLDSERGTPRNSLSRHRYAYVMNNPVRYYDPLGLYPTISEIARTAYEDREIGAAQTYYDDYSITAGGGECWAFVRDLYDVYNNLREQDGAERIDVSFLFGGNGPSGIVSRVLAPGSNYCGYVLWKQGEPEPSQSKLKAGDILVSDVHIALYIGSGEIAQTSSGDLDPKGPGLHINKLGDTSKGGTSISGYRVIIRPGSQVGDCAENSQPPSTSPIPIPTEPPQPAPILTPPPSLIFTIEAGPLNSFDLEPHQTAVIGYKPTWSIWDSWKGGRSEYAHIHASGKAKIVEYWSDGGFYKIPGQSEKWILKSGGSIKDYLWIWSKQAHFRFIIKNLSSKRTHHFIEID